MVEQFVHFALVFIRRSVGHKCFYFFFRGRQRAGDVQASTDGGVHPPGLVCTLPARCRPRKKKQKYFLADASPNKGESKVNELLDRPAYAAWRVT